jgi:steroid delta-isomerase-like uncharacterized protein
MTTTENNRVLTDTTVQEANKAVVRKYVSAFNQGDTETLQQLFAPDALIYGVLGWGKILEVVPVWQELHAAFAIELNIESIIAEGDTVAVRYTERGTFRRPFRGKEPTGRSYELVAMEWFVLRKGRIECRWGARDAASQTRQLNM